MYLSDRDLEYAIERGQLIIDPRPEIIDTSSIDVHLDSINEARIWDTEKFAKSQNVSGQEAHLMIGKFDHKQFSAQYGIPVPGKGTGTLVYREGNTIIVKPGGFLLWQTKEKNGTPEEYPQFICFVDGKSTRARTGILVHMTAPTIHAGWWGQVTLEIANLGPFTIGLKEDDAIAQIIVASISSPPSKQKNATSIAIGQKDVTGSSSASRSQS